MSDFSEQKGFSNPDDLEAFSLELSLPGVIPRFIEKWFQHRLISGVENSLVSELDDLKEWLRVSAGELSRQSTAVAELLLIHEKKLQQQAEEKGEVFDRLGFELEQLDQDENFELLPQRGSS